MIVHQIWIGPKPAPRIWMDTVRDFCASYGHTYMYWGNKEIAELDLSPYTGIQELMDEYGAREKSYKYAGQADILRTVLLYVYGGVYIDSDSVIVNGQRFDRFLRDNSASIFYGWENKDIGLIANGVIGCPKGHAYMKKCLEDMPDYARTHATKPVWERTGPYFVSHMYHHVGQSYPGEIVIVPKHYFYPKDWHGIKTTDAHKDMTFDPDTMMFQYGYTTNNMDKFFGGSMGFWKKILFVLLIVLVVYMVAMTNVVRTYVVSPLKKVFRAIR